MSLPGSYPTETMVSQYDTAITGQEQEKVQKVDKSAGRGHFHTDSGVGIAPGQDPSAPRNFSLPLESDEHDGTRDSTQSNTVTEAYPYWGDLPQGQGVYNSVTGHGSNDKEARRHQLGDTHEYTGSSDASQQRSFPLVTDRTITGARDATLKQQPVQTEGKADRDVEAKPHWKEDAACVAGAGTAGAALYQATHDDDEHTKSSGRDTFHTTEPSNKNNDEKRGGIFDIFHRGEHGNNHKHKDKGQEKEKEEKRRPKEKKPIPIAGGLYKHDHTNEAHEESQQMRDVDTGDRGANNDAALAAATVAFTQQHPDNAFSRQQKSSPGEKNYESHETALEPGTTSKMSAHQASGTDNEPFRDQYGVMSSGKVTDTLVDREPGSDNTRREDWSAPKQQQSSRVHQTLGASHGNETSGIVPQATQAANEGTYNTLSSGTPSGIRLNDDQKETTTITSGRKESRVAGLAAAGAAATGVSTLAAREDDEKVKDKTDKSGMADDNIGSGTSVSPQKMIHKCVKCGEENDISAYFRDRRGGQI